MKKEFAVSWPDRARNAWHGFGWCSTAVREGAILQALREAGIGCPDVVALGEDGRQAFVLLRDESALPELRAILPTLPHVDQVRLANALGAELARMHDAGFDHPDLFAKHILVSPQSATIHFCILDWQRARRRGRVSWRVRCRDLAILDATLHDTLASDRLRLRCLHAYARAISDQDRRPPLGRLARQIRLNAIRLREQRHMREIGQLPVPAHDQQFVSLRAGRLLLVHSYHEELGGKLPVLLTKIMESAGAVQAIKECALGSQMARLQTFPKSSTPWEIPTLAHTLFRLQRFGVPAPRLLAVGCAEDHVFALTAVPAFAPLPKSFAKASLPAQTRLLQQAGRIIRQLHEAGYCLRPGDTWERLLGVTPTGGIMLAQVERLLRGKTRWQELAPLEFKRQQIRLSRTEQLRFLQGYLQAGLGPRKPLFLSDSTARERRTVA